MTNPTETAAGAPVLLRRDDGAVVHLTLNRPHRFNALNGAMIDALQETLNAIADADHARVVVLGASGRAFCAGHDLKEMRARPEQPYYEALFARCSRVMRTIAEIPQPVIARVHGIATAAGCQLVAACDLAVASTDASFAVSGIRQGLFCSTPSVALTRNVGRKRAFEMLMTGDFIDADTAVRRGLVNRAVPPDALDREVGRLARSIVAHPRAAVATGKQLFYRQLETDLASAYEMAGEAMACNMMDGEAVEGIDAFLEKRAPRWAQNGDPHDE